MEDKSELENKIKGTLLGLAVADALGGPLEFMSKNQIQIKHGTVNQMIGGGWLHLRPGQYTEDTILMMSTAESLVECKKLDLQDVMKRFLRWYRTNPKDIGPITRGVFALIQEGGDPQNAAFEIYEELTGQNHDNDPLPRCVPLAILYFQDSIRLMEETFKLARLTHYEKKVASGPVVINLIIAEILKGKKEKKEILTQVNNILDENELGIYNILPDPSSKKKENLNPSARMQDTIEIALWGWIHTKSFREAIVTVVNLGGDTDTIGAATGAIAGAYYGEENIPEEWLSMLEDKNIIASLAKRLYKLALP